MKPSDELYTVDEVAMICNMSVPAVKKCLKDGDIRAYKSLFTHHYRVLRGDIIKFLRELGLPTDHWLLIPFKVLVIDDEPEMGYEIEGMLKTYSALYAVEVATSSYEGCRLLEDFLPDIVILNSRMKGLNGKEMMEFINRRSGGRVRVIVVTEHQEDLPEMIDRRVDDHLLIPFSREELLRKVGMIIERSAA